MDTFVAKVFYWKKCLLEQSPAVGPVKTKFISNFLRFTYWMIQKQASKIAESYENKAFLFQFWFLQTYSKPIWPSIHFEDIIFFSEGIEKITWNGLVSNLTEFHVLKVEEGLVKKSTKMQFTQKAFFGLKRVQSCKGRGRVKSQLKTFLTHLFPMHLSPYPLKTSENMFLGGRERVH